MPPFPSSERIRKGPNARRGSARAAATSSSIAVPTRAMLTCEPMTSLVRVRSLTLPGTYADLAPRFLDSLPYDPSVLVGDELRSIDPAAKRVTGAVDTTKPLPFTDAQRGDPAHHPRHVNGGVMIHLTGMLGCVHAFFLNGLRFDE